MTDKQKKSSGSSLNFMWIFGLIMAIITIVFALQNSSTEGVNFFTFHAEIPMALLIFACLALGAIVTILFSIPGQWRRKREKDALNKQIKGLEEQLSQLQQKQIATDAEVANKTITE